MPIVTATYAGPVCIPPPARTACPSVPPSPTMHDPALLGDAIKLYRPLPPPGHPCRYRGGVRVHEQHGAPVTPDAARLHEGWAGRVVATVKRALLAGAGKDPG